MRKHIPQILFKLILAVFVVGSRANAQDLATLKGTVKIPAGKGTPADTVVYLMGKIGDATTRDATIEMKDERFTPRVTVVPVGSSIEFRNNDSVLHNPFSSFSLIRFDLGTIQPEKSQRYTFNQAGVARLGCRVHSKAEGFVVIADNSYFAQPDEAGNFQIANIPRGHYKLRVWHESLKPLERDVNLDEIKIDSLELRLVK